VTYIALHLILITMFPSSAKCLLLSSSWDSGRYYSCLVPCKMLFQIGRGINEYS